MMRPLVLAAALFASLTVVPYLVEPVEVQATHVPICWTLGPLFDDLPVDLCVVDCVYDAITSGQVKRISACFPR